MAHAAPQRVVAYLDGFNLYHGVLDGTPFKWLNPKRLVEVVLPGSIVSHLHFFTAKVTAPADDPEKASRQDTYCRALRTVEEIQIHYGHFLSNPKWFPLASLRPVIFKGVAELAPPAGGMVRVARTEEKGSDVNLGSRLAFDAAGGALQGTDAAIVITNDSDLVAPIREVRERYHIKVGILFPVSPGAKSRSVSVELQRVCDFHRLIDRSALAKSQFQDVLRDSVGEFRKPERWTICSCSGPTGQHGFLAEEYTCQVHVGGQCWQSVREYMIAQEQTLGRTWQSLAGSPGMAQPGILANPYLGELLWLAARNELLLSALRAKFSDPGLARQLLDTGGAQLVCVGKPHLGRALEIVRRELRQRRPALGARERL